MNRFDICAAYYLFCSRWNSGQWSLGYKKLSQLARMRFSPGVTLQQGKFENENQRAIYKRLLKRKDEF